MSKNNLGCCSGRPFATQVAENKTRLAAAEGEMLMLSMLLLSVIIIIIYNKIKTAKRYLVVCSAEL